MTEQQPDPYGPQNPYGQPPQYPAPYGQPPYPPPYPVAPPTNTMAILALVLAFVFSPLGIVFGHIAKKQIRQTGESGDGLATAGLVLGYVFTGIMVAICLCYGVLFAGLCGLGGLAPLIGVTPTPGY